MVHFLRNKLYRLTSCKQDKSDVKTATSHTLVTCPVCIDHLIEWKTEELVFLKERRLKLPLKPERKKPKKQMEISFDLPERSES